MKLDLGVRAAVAATLLTGCTALSQPDDEGLDPNERVTSPIVGGTEATAFKEAALIGMARNGRTVAACSGSVIAPRVALTAGHCVAGFDAWTVRAPFVSQSVRGSSGETFDWRDDGSGQVNPNQHDIGLIYLDTAITLPQYPALAERAVADGTRIVNIGRINNGQLSNTSLFVSRPIPVRNATNVGFPFDYAAMEVIESGDSGGPDELPSADPHVIVAVNSGAGSGTEVLARVDLLRSWILEKIAAHGGGGNNGGGGTTPPPPDAGAPPDSGAPGPTPPPPSCPAETEPNDSFRTPNALGSSACGRLAGADQDWFSWSIAGATPYSVRLSATGDAQLAMWKFVNGSFARVANSSATEITHTSSGAGSYVVVVFSNSGQTQSYTLTLMK
jgi:hypothetical protein